MELFISVIVFLFLVSCIMVLDHQTHRCSVCRSGRLIDDGFGSLECDNLSCQHHLNKH